MQYPSTEPPQGMRWQRGEPSCAPGHGCEPRTYSATTGRGWNLRPSRAERISRTPRSRAPGESGEVGAALLPERVAPLLCLLAHVEQQRRVPGELLHPGRAVGDRVESALQHAQRERRALQQLTRPGDG